MPWRILSIIDGSILPVEKYIKDGLVSFLSLHFPLYALICPSRNFPEIRDTRKGSRRYDIPDVDMSTLRGCITKNQHVHMVWNEQHGSPEYRGSVCTL